MIYIHVCMHSYGSIFKPWCSQGKLNFRRSVREIGEMGSSNTGGAKDESPADGGKARAVRSGSESPDGAAATYFEGEKVLAYHGPAIYEAKVCVRVRVLFSVSLFCSWIAS